jgi:glycosyltransferase involved in cell wall biosynthesis
VSGPIRLSLDVSAVPDRPVGAGRYTIELARALAVRPDVALTLWARRGDGVRWTPGFASEHGHEVVVRAVAPDRRPERLVWEQVRLSGLLAHESVDVHHGPHYTMPERARLPVVVTVHDLTFFDHPEWHQRSKAPVFRRAIRVAARRAAAVVCVSSATAERFESLLRPRGRVFTVPHGVDAERFRPSEPSPGADDAVLGRLGVRRPYALFLGTLEPRKAVPELVRAFDRVADSHADLQLVLTGRAGWGDDELQRVLGAARHGDRIRRTGYAADDDLPALLRGARALVYPARQEGFGLPALEALACGTPLVTTAGTVMAELAGGAALLVSAGSVDELADALATTAENEPDDGRRRSGLAVAAAHTWEVAAEGHLAAYRWAMEESRSARPGRERGVGEAEGSDQ